MAESNQRKVADPIDLHDEDPFAELTRIMGFDPRVAARAEARETPAPVVKPQPMAVVTPLTPKVAANAAPAVVAKPVATVRPVAHDDFSLDLEKELLGEFADFEAPQHAAPVAATPQPVARETVSAVLPHVAVQASQPVVAAPPVAATSQQHAPLDDDAIQAAFDDQFDEAFAGIVDEPPQMAVAPRQVEAKHQLAQPVAEAEPAAHADIDHELAFDLGDLDFDHHDEPAAAPAVAEVTVPVAEARHEALSHDDLMADVDMDFAAAFDHELGGAVDADLDRTDDQAVAAVPDPQSETVQPVAASAERTAPAPAADAHDLIDLSLEDELGALLDAAHEPVAAAPAPVVSAAQPEKPLSDPRWAALEADEEDEPVQSSFQPARPAAGDWSIGRQADTRRSYSDPSLTGRHANFKEAKAPEPEPVADLDDLISAMDSEVHGGAPRAAARSQTEMRQPAQPQAHVPFNSGFAPVAPTRETAPPASYAYDELDGDADYEAAPEIETVDVAESAVPVAHDLDIPELAYEEDEQRYAAYDDLDADFSAAFNDKSPREEAVNQTVRQASAPSESVDFEADFDALYRSSFPSSRDAGSMQGDSYQGAQADYAPQADYDDESAARRYDDFDGSDAEGRDRFVDLDFATDADDEPVPAYSAYQAVEQRSQPPRRGLMIAAIVGGVAILGGVGALALSYGRGDAGASGTPVVVKADDGPVKVKPENPGGTVVPNQDSKVYDAVKGADTATSQPAQEKLVTTSEEPVDMAAVDENGDLPGLNMEDDVVPKAEDRVDPAAADADQGPAPAEGIAVTPRKVKTMVVRADGTLVAREDPAPAAAESTATAAPVEPVAKTDATGAVAAAEPADTTAEAASEPAPVKPVKTKPVATETQAETAAPEASALPPANTEEQPAAAKTEDSTEVAAVEPTAIAAGAWSVQIASQPSAEAAKSSYQDLAKRYASVIGGRGVNIVKAEIAGKGTYWRVRVPAKSRDDAVQLCTDYKAAGGNCFVSK